MIDFRDLTAIMISVAAVLALFFLGGCDPSNNTGADGYQFASAEYFQPEVKVSVVEAEDQAHLERIAKVYGVELPKGQLGAFGVLDEDRTSCRIFIVDPTYKYMPEWIGHEIAHCFYGRWHSDAPRG